MPRENKPTKCFCSICRTDYDANTNSMICPHTGFPRIVECKKHGRKNCGDPECNVLLLSMPQSLKEKRA